MGWGMWILFVIWMFPHVTPFFLGGSFGVSIKPRDPIGTAWTVLSAPVGVQANVVASLRHEIEPDGRYPKHIQDHPWIRLSLGCFEKVKSAVLE
jgi:hypothetical protein